MGYQRRKGPIDYKGYGQKKKPGRKSRISTTGILFILCVGGLVVWLLTSDQVTKEEGATGLGVESFQDRKNIYDRLLEPLAVSFDLYAAYIKPLEVEDTLQTGETLATILSIDQEQLTKRLRTERSFIWLGHQVPRAKVSELSKLNMAGLYFQKSPVRFYPHQKTAAQVLGCVKDDQGLSGIELFYDKELRGKALAGIDAQAGRQIFDEGKHIVLTLDLKTQTILEKQMALLLDKTQASSVAAMAVDPATGEIVASVQLPSFDPNTFWDATPQSQKMVMVSRLMNPGGISGLFRYGAAVHADRDIQMRERQSSSSAMTTPGIPKDASLYRAGKWWPWPGGGFISDELAFLPDPTIAEKELRDFQNDLGISCADRVDVPINGEAILAGEECGEGRLNGVSILGAFTRLVNGGKPVALHFLKGTMDSGGNYASYEFKAPGREVAKVSAVLRKSFAASAGDKSRFFAAEFLNPLSRNDDFIVESQEGDKTTEVFKRGQTYDGLLLAASPPENPRLVLLVTVQDGEFDLKSASPMRKFGDAFLRLAAKEMKHISDPDVSSSALISEEELFSDWQRLQPKEVMPQKELDKHVRKMPDVVGMSLRKALLELMPCRVEVEIEGAGKVVGQEPAPGKECVDRVRIRLASDHKEQQK
ncbi:MAG: PASTA domain-containing protein [Proteobacteria bacterium]|nr:PASTA domain-containing protein [Pseudomonadota bacterium]MBU1640844.1 PASTA domain-containing protein [Pseudomonadota bacterium]